jgi:hypothetical protein
MKLHVSVCAMVLVMGGVAGAVEGMVQDDPITLKLFNPLVDERTEITVSPQTIRPSDEVFVNVSRKVMGGDYQFVKATLQTHGTIVRLDLQWDVANLVPQAFQTIKHKESIGRWRPGKYTLIVTNDGKGTTLASFTVSADSPDSGPTGWDFINQFPGNAGNFSPTDGGAIDRLQKAVHDSSFIYHIIL